MKFLCCLSKLSWLQESFVRKGVKLVRRQALPSEALLLNANKAVKQADDEDTGVISHGWLLRGHPDPQSHRRADIENSSALSKLDDQAMRVGLDARTLVQFDLITLPHPDTTRLSSALASSPPRFLPI